MTITAKIQYNNQTLETLNILQLQMKIQEGEYGQLKVLAEKQDIKDHNITLDYCGQTLFKGSLLGNPRYIEPSCMELIYIAKPRNNILKPKSEESYFQNLNPKPWHLPYVDVINGQQSEISMLANEDGPDISEHILENSIHVEQVRIPLGNIRVVVGAQWIQRGSGSINLFPFIKKTFPNQRVLTLSGKGLLESLPHMGQRLGQSLSNKTGYTVLSAKLAPIKDLRESTLPVLIGGQKHFLPIEEYAGHFWLQWDCAFKHKEEARFLLQWNNGYYQCLPDNTNIIADQQLEFIVDCHKITTEMYHFFETPQGKNALKQAAEQSLYKGLQSQNSHMLTIKVPFNIGTKYSVGSSVKIEHPQYGMINGRIMGLKSIYHAYDAHTLMMIGFSKGMIDAHASMKNIVSLEQNMTLIQCTHAPETVFENTNTIQPQELIQNIVVKNPLSNQVEYLNGIDFKDKTELLNILKQHMTEIYFELKNLSNKNTTLKIYGYQS